VAEQPKVLAGVVRAIDSIVDLRRQSPSRIAAIIQRESGIGELVEACLMRIDHDADGFWRVRDGRGGVLIRELDHYSQAENYIASKRTAALVTLTKEDHNEQR
jgi:hypothetical protein